MRSLRFLLFSALFLFNQNSRAALCKSTGNGDWNTAGSWSCGHVPACGDSVVIQAGHTIEISNQQNYSTCVVKITIFGKLSFDNGSKLKLGCVPPNNSSIYVMPGGSITAGTGGGNSNYIEICSDIMWNAAAPDITSPTCFPPWQPGCSLILPVQITEFAADLVNNNQIELNWATASEKDNDHFDVERSKDAASFEKVISIPTKAINGNSSSHLTYSAIDDEPYSNISYYRLKLVDKTQGVVTSKIVSVNVIKAKNVRFLIYPNPNNGEFTADISGIENNHQVQILLRNSNGETVYDSSFFLQETNAKLQIVPRSKLPSGTYMCSLILEGIEYNVKVVVS